MKVKIKAKAKVKAKIKAKVKTKTIFGHIYACIIRSFPLLVVL